jgi:hypothetical protein
MVNPQAAEGVALLPATELAVVPAGSMVWPYAATYQVPESDGSVICCAVELEL